MSRFLQCDIRFRRYYQSTNKGQIGVKFQELPNLTIYISKFLSCFEHFKYIYTFRKFELSVLRKIKSTFKVHTIDYWLSKNKSWLSPCNWIVFVLLSCQTVLSNLKTIFQSLWSLWNFENFEGSYLKMVSCNISASRTTLLM